MLNPEARFWLEATAIFGLLFGPPAALAYWIIKTIIRSKTSKP
ncbi:hypothetical protein [Runella rosea]|nr:hypothetical protein [Runella rosea]